MELIRFAIKNPVTVLVGVFMICLFGYISLISLPVQLTPNIDKPEVVVSTTWEGASPQEVEREIVEEQEEKLKSIQGLKKMVSSSYEGRSSITLEFDIGTDMSRALFDTADRLRQVPKYPDNVKQPTVRSGGDDVSRAIAWFILRSFPPRDDIVTEYDFLNDTIKPRLERVPGVSSINIFGGIEREIHIRIDPDMLALRGLTLMEVRDAIQRSNVNISGGNIEEGKRDYVIRTMGEYTSIREILETVIRGEKNRVIYLKDIGDAVFGYKKQGAVVRAQGNAALALNAVRQSGTNVIEVMNGLQEAVAKANEEVLKSRGLELTQVYDETLYIRDAISLVKNNLLVGGILAVIVLLVFLRNIESTIIIAMAIPISVIGTFLLLKVFGRNLNVISLAGMAFAVGMVVDNSIVVLENIFRHLQAGEKPFDAALKGGMEVWGAVLSSTLTTLAVFIPVILVREEAGQLFRDIAVAISSAVAISLLVSVFFIPMAAARLHKSHSTDGNLLTRFLHHNLFGLVPLASLFTSTVVKTVGRINRSWLLRILTVCGMTAVAIAISVALWPPLSYLPEGNQNLVIGFLIPPPGYGQEELKRMSKTIEERLRPYYETEPGTPEAAKLDGPLIRSFFIVSRGQSVFMGLRAREEKNVKGLVNLVRKVTAIPGVFSFAAQRSIFQRGLGTGNSVDVEISGSNMKEIISSSMIMMMEISKTFGFPRPDPPNFNIGGPEVQIIPDRNKIAELGLTNRDMGFIVRSVVDGSIIGEYWDKGDKIDIKLRLNGKGGQLIEHLASIPVATPTGKQVPLSSIVSMEFTEGRSQINHIEERRAVKLVVTPPPTMELETTMVKIAEEIVKPLRANKMIPPDIEINLAGTADKLISTRKSLQWNLLLALLITYLLMASLFESFLYPFVIMFSVPLAAAGGIAGFSIIHNMTGEHLNILTMLGFIILIGTVVNNAILIVHQALNNMRTGGMTPDDAVVDSVKTRIRPIFMSTTTSICGMLPLVMMSGAGSELYRGLGSVVIGGLLVSTIFTLFVVPTLFSLVLSIGSKISGAKAAVQ